MDFDSFLTALVDFDNDSSVTWQHSLGCSRPLESTQVDSLTVLWQVQIWHVPQDVKLWQSFINLHLYLDNGFLTCLDQWGTMCFTLAECLLHKPQALTSLLCIYQRYEGFFMHYFITVHDFLPSATMNTGDIIFWSEPSALLAFIQLPVSVHKYQKQKLIVIESGRGG